MRRDCKLDLEDTVRLLRKYMNEQRPQSFAAMHVTYMTLLKRCKICGIKTEKYTDIEQYAKAEKIERFGFEY